MATDPPVTQTEFALLRKDVEVLIEQNKAMSLRMDMLVVQVAHFKLDVIKWFAAIMTMTAGAATLSRYLL